MAETPCDYCGCDVTAHDPVYVEEPVDGDRTRTGAFCSYGCLAAYIEREGLANGTVCHVDVE